MRGFGKRQANKPFLITFGKIHGAFRSLTFGLADPDLRNYLKRGNSKRRHIMAEMVTSQ